MYIEFGDTTVCSCKVIEYVIILNNFYYGVPVAQWLEHCVSRAKGCGFDSQGAHILTIQKKNPEMSNL